MIKHRIPQEGLKAVACITMLIDHIGAVLFPTVRVLRLIGRISFPIYCFLLVEGYSHTRNLKKYFNRMFAGCLLAEIPYDLAFSGTLTLESQSVMVSLMLGLAMIHVLTKVGEPAISPLIIAGFYFAAELAHCDYSGQGILVMALFYFFRDRNDRHLLWALLLAAVCLIIPSSWMQIGPVRFPTQLFGVAAIPFIIMYSGERCCTNRPMESAIQTCFYLFYPLHLAVLWLLKVAA